MTSAIIKRFHNMNPATLLDDLFLEPGNIRDYEQLKEYHYLADRPATVTRVFVYRYRPCCAVERYLGQAHSTRVIAVLVESIPVINCQMRDIALAGRYRQWRKLSDRARIVSREIRTISRVVVHPQFRSLGLAKNLVKHLLANPETVYTETLAAMGNIHPFFKLAGMRQYDRPMTAADARLVQACQTANLIEEEDQLAAVTIENIMQLENNRRQWMAGEINRWYRTVNNRNASHLTTAQQLAAAQRRILYRPRYYLYDRRWAQQSNRIGEDNHATEND